MATLANYKTEHEKNVSSLGGNYIQNAASVHAASWYGANGVMLVKVNEPKLFGIY